MCGETGKGRYTVRPHRNDSARKVEAPQAHVSSTDYSVVFSARSDGVKLVSRFTLCWTRREAEAKGSPQSTVLTLKNPGTNLSIIPTKMAAGRILNWRKLPISLSELCIDTTLRCGQSFRSVQCSSISHATA